MRRTCISHTFFIIDHFCGQSKIRNFYHFVLQQNIGGFDVSMKIALWGVIMASLNDLLRKNQYFFVVDVKKMLPDVLLKVLLTVFKKEIEVIFGLLNIEHLNDVWVFETSKSLVLFLNSLYKILKVKL